MVGLCGRYEKPVNCRLVFVAKMATITLLRMSRGLGVPRRALREAVKAIWFVCRQWGCDVAESEIAKDARAIGDWFSQKAQSGFQQIDQTYKEIKEGTSKAKAVRTERPAEPRQARESSVADLGLSLVPALLIGLGILVWKRRPAAAWVKVRLFSSWGSPRA